MPEQIIIPLPNGGTLRCDEGIECAWGSAVRICDSTGNEIVMWDSAEWEATPEEVMGAIFAAAVQPLTDMIRDLGKTKVVDGCWV